MIMKVFSVFYLGTQATQMALCDLPGQRSRRPGERDFDDDVTFYNFMIPCSLTDNLTVRFEYTG